MSDLRQQMREYGLGGELDDADQDDLREVLCQAAIDRERMARAERALKIERAISDFWEAEDRRRRSVTWKGTPHQTWERWSGRIGSPRAHGVNVVPHIVWWHAHRRDR